MIKNLLAVVLFFTVISNTVAQFNSYKYIVVPIKFDAFKNQNEYKTSTYIKHFFTSNGYMATYDTNLPEDLAANNCLGLFLDLIDDSSLFTTKTTIVFKDCKGNEIYRTITGKSKEKEYVSSYQKALSAALTPIKKIEYSYKPSTSVDDSSSVTLNFKDDVKQMPVSKVDENEEVIESIEETVVEDISEEIRQSEKESKEKNSEITDSETIIMGENVGDVVKKTEVVMDEMMTLYAQPTANGYQLVDTTPKVVYYLTNTSVPDVFLAESANKTTGLVFKKDDKWFVELNTQDGKKLEEITIKF